MSKRVKTIIIGAAVIVVLAAAVAVLLLLPKDSGETTSSQTVSSSTISLVSETSDTLESVKIKNSKDEYTIDLVGEKLWRIKELQDFTPNEANYSSVRNDVCSIAAMSIVEEDSQKLADYGLADPEIVVEAKFKTGTSYRIALGNLSPDGSRRYAMMLGQDKNTVYALPSTALSSASLTRNDYLDLTVVPAYTGTDDQTAPVPTQITIERPDLEQPIRLEKPAEEAVSSGGVTVGLKLISPVEALMNENWLEKSVIPLFGLTATSVAKANPGEADLAEYGFNTPKTFTIQYDQSSSFKLIVGNALDSDGKVTDSAKKAASYYVMKEGTNLIYVVASSSMSWVTVQPKDLLSTIAVLPYIMDVESLKLTLDGKDYVIGITKVSTEEETDELEFTLNGKKAKEDPCKKFYQLLLSTAIQDINTEQPDGNPVMSVTYQYRDGRSEKLDFYVQKDLSTIVSLNGNMAYKGRSGLIDKVRKEVVNLQNGDAVDTDW